MKNNILDTIMTILKPMNDVTSKETECYKDKIITLSKYSTIFAIIVDNELFLISNSNSKSLNKKYLYNANYYEKIDISNLKQASARDNILNQATNAYWIATQQKQ